MEEKNERAVKEIDLDDILPNRFQPRVRFKEEELAQLANSIKKHGVIQPIIVREIGDKYEIIAGERRYKASVLAGLTTIPAIINNVTDAGSNEIALIENVQRQDLTPIEEAASYKKILDLGNFTQEDLAVKVEKKQSTISNKLRLLNLCDAVQEALMNEQISERHARSLLRLKDEEKQKKVMNKIINERLTVRQTDVAIDKMLETKADVDEIQIEDVEKSPAEKEVSENTKEAASEMAQKTTEETQFSSSIDNYKAAETSDDDEFKSSPGFLDIDNIEKNARDINETEEPKDWEALLKEDTPHEEITKDLAKQGYSMVESEEAEETENKEYGQAESGRFFKFSPGELIEKEEEKPVPKAPKTTEELTGFNFQPKGVTAEEKKNHEKIKDQIDQMLDKYKKEGIATETEEIDLEDQIQIIVKVKKD